ncbi:thiol-disulfide oxidoreductase DCC family protein [Lysinibacillus xylanilyticus]|uniref:thiol-disulfide oxidoreductase DCC family protein n=1 Tax=Lysinibacillus xylanilyticus TaxID=582475 RepID=UPI002B2488DB|nr:thiol-disulfide oxidoreductase DCC family protein [Lysinibacillus xylanilyticus]MEB2299981.1 thiol-disulfide oxidoreductase DCC family protein [Lysinibacillus xylanilyticus]
MGGVILFDGVCNFCDSSVQFIIKYDQVAYFQFASIQSDAGQALLAQYEIPENIDSVILIEHGKVYFESTAALKICRRLNSFWPVCYVFILIPSSIRNIMYRLFAKNRYRLFGRKEKCLLPTPSQRRRFL